MQILERMPEPTCSWDIACARRAWFHVTVYYEDGLTLAHNPCNRHAREVFDYFHRDQGDSSVTSVTWSQDWSDSEESF